MQLKTLIAGVGRTERIGSATIFGAGAFLLWEASALPFGAVRAPDSGFFPISLAAIILVLGLVLVVRAGRIGGTAIRFDANTLSVALTFTAFLFYGLLLERIGFLLSTEVVLVVVIRAYGRMPWRHVFLLTAPAVLATYYGFGLLGVPLPAGLLAAIGF